MFFVTTAASRPVLTSPAVAPESSSQTVTMAFNPRSKDGLYVGMMTNPTMTACPTNGILKKRLSTFPHVDADVRHSGFSGFTLVWRGGGLGCAGVPGGEPIMNTAGVPWDRIPPVFAACSRATRKLWASSEFVDLERGEAAREAAPGFGVGGSGSGHDPGVIGAADPEAPPEPCGRGVGGNVESLAALWLLNGRVSGPSSSGGDHTPSTFVEPRGAGVGAARSNGS